MTTRPRIVGQSVPPPLPPSVGGSSPVEDEESYPSIPRNTGDERTPNQLESADWRTDLRTQLAKDLRAVADDLGQPSFVLDNWMDEQFDVMLNYLYAQGFIAREEDFNASVDVLVPGGGSLTIGDMGDQRFEDLSRTPTIGGKYNPFSIEGLSAIYQASLLWVGAQIPGFNQIRGNTQVGGSGGSRGPPGRKKPRDRHLLSPSVKRCLRRETCLTIMDASVSEAGETVHEPLAIQPGKTASPQVQHFLGRTPALSVSGRT